MKSIDSIVIHHSASSRDATTLEDIRMWHTDPDKPGGAFEDIGYHFCVEADGGVRHGRALPRTGAHAPPNSGRIGICIVGDNTVFGEEWKIEQVLAARVLIDALHQIWPGLPVEGHRDVMAEGHTECPGVDVARLFD